MKNQDEINEILEMMRQHELTEFELEREGVTLRLRKNSNAQWAANMPPGVGACSSRSLCRK